MSPVISLKRYLETNQRELLNSTLDNFRAALGAMGDSGAVACPSVGTELQRSLWQLQERLAAAGSPEDIAKTEAQVEAELKNWGARTAEYYRAKAGEVKEIMTILTRAAQSASDRGEQYSDHFARFAERIETIADLEDVSEIRKSVVQNAAELRRQANEVKREAEESVSEMRAEIAAYQSRLEEAERLAAQDPLTGLANRRGIEQHMDIQAAIGRRFSLMLFDLNGFKEVNDRHGHLAGDELLRQFASELKSYFRSTDVVGRWGGDEFIAVLACSEEGARAQMERVESWVCGDYTLLTSGVSHKVKVSAAIGVAEWQPGELAAAALARADADMYTHKTGPRRPAARTKS